MSHFAFRLFEQRQRPRIVISRLDGWPAGFPCQRFASHLAMRLRMTRGQGDSPFLPRIGLPPTTTVTNYYLPVCAGALKPRLSQNLLTFSGLVRRRGFYGFGKKGCEPWRTEVRGEVGFGGQVAMVIPP